MRTPPPYFEAIRRRARQRWNQLEQDPELAAPWHQLFRQVQSPRHVLSELLQNADDAGATEAAARIEGGFFVFEHNGHDFTEEEFASLCGFGFSNKRILHTIGFRGVGFKSTFSLGDTVELYTPTLAVCFARERFTEPGWIETDESPPSGTRIRVAIADERRIQETIRNLEAWRRDPVSLLFFRHIRKLELQGKTIEWECLGPGPVANSEWVRLAGEKQPRLLVRSEPAALPPEAIEEIRHEQPLLGREDTFPPCTVEIVTQAKGRLYVVLPTELETDLPFACNAPFVQDPARMKIKDPGISPMNRWVLERIGRLAAEAMLHWLGRGELPARERAAAYCLMPACKPDGDSLPASVSQCVEQAFDRAVWGRPLLLTDEGQLVQARQAVILPGEILEVWPAREAGRLFDQYGRPPLSRAVSASDRDNLLRKKRIEAIEKKNVIQRLTHGRIPRPSSWDKLAILWSYLAPEITRYWSPVQPPDLRIVPVAEADELYPATQVVRVSRKEDAFQTEEISFLHRYLKLLDPDWLDYLEERKKENSETAKALLAVLDNIGLSRASTASDVINKAAHAFFNRQDPSLDDAVRLTQIAAHVGAEVGDAFRFRTRDGKYRPASQGVLFDEDGRLEELLPEAYREQHLLDHAYTSRFIACTPQEWSSWVRSERSSLCSLPPLVNTWRWVTGRQEIEKEVRQRGFTGQISFPYLSDDFRIQDWDFDSSVWRHWQELSREAQSLWCEIGRRLLEQPPKNWEDRLEATFLQVARNGYERRITNEPIPPAWVLRLRELPCLPDTHGVPALPCELARRTRETEAVLDVERFVAWELDNEHTRPLLDLLGVRTKPLGPEVLLDRLRALARAKNPPAAEADKWYRRLDQMILACTPAQFETIRTAFREEALILTQDERWVSSDSVFLNAEELGPGVPVIRPAVADLTLWPRIGVPERPTWEYARARLAQIASGQTLSGEDARLVRALLARFPREVWNQLGCWLNLAGQWTPVSQLSWSLSMQSLVPWQHLVPWVKQGTADFQMLSVEQASQPPFSKLPALANCLENRPVYERVETAQPKEWLAEVAACLARVVLDDEESTSRVRALAARLQRTRWQVAHGLRAEPCLNGKPAGTPRAREAVWWGEQLLVAPVSGGKLAKAVPEELGRAFTVPEIKDALRYCFERSAAEIREYFHENFNIGEASATEARGPGEDEAPLPPEEEPQGNLIDEAELPGHEVKRHSRGPWLIHEYAAGRGFRKLSAVEWVDDDGRRLIRLPDLPARWEEWDPQGRLIRYYIAIRAHLDDGKFEIAAELWDLMEQSPDQYSLILEDTDGRPHELRATQLMAWKNEGRLTLYPAAYRVVLHLDHDDLERL